MRQTGFNSFRTSTQWPRLITDLGTDALGPGTVRFYHAYLDEMIANGIGPMINLYRFDILEAPQKQYDGSESAYVAELFAHFACTALSLLGHEVKYWMTLNESIMPAGGGHLCDSHYLCKRDGQLAAQVAFGVMLAHARAVTAYRELALVGEIGAVLNLTPNYTLIDNDADKRTAGYVGLFFNRSFLGPLVKHEFPKVLCEILAAHDCLPTTSKDGVALALGAEIGFLGVNYYVPRRVKA